jgi:large subunit ribosomal protein L19e
MPHQSNYLLQKRLAGRLLGCSPTRVKVDPARMADIKEGITKDDVRKLIRTGALGKAQEAGISKYWQRQRKHQRARQRRRGHGSRKGRANARADDKRTWIASLRAQRAVLRRMRELGRLEHDGYRLLYAKSKGGFFRSTRHLMLYAEEQELLKRQA